MRLMGEVKEILAKWFKDPIDKPCAYCEASKEVIAKLQKHYRDMTPEKLREEVKDLILQVRQHLCNTEFAPEPFTEPVDINKLTIDFPNQILSLVNGNLIERIKGIENPWKWNKDYEERTAPGPYVGFDEAIQVVIKEVQGGQELQ